MEYKQKNGSSLRLVKKATKSELSWLLVPGGPGIKSDYMVAMAAQFDIDLNIFTFDLPRTNPFKTNVPADEQIKFWQEDLIQAVSTCPNSVVVSHSFGGMLALSTKGLEDLCKGAIFFDSSPNMDWQAHSAQAKEKIDQTETLLAATEFAKNPSDNSFKVLCTSYSPFYFLRQFEKEGRTLLANNSYNHYPYLVSGEFFKAYQNTWQNWTFPTLCLAGDSDLITPVSLFSTDPLFKSKSNVEIASIKNAGHFPWVENPQDFFDRLGEFHKKYF